MQKDWLKYSISQYVRISIRVSIGNKLKYRDLEKIYTIVMEKITLNLNNCVFSAVINKKFAKKENENRKTNIKEQDVQDDEKDDIDPNTDILSSFYVSDIDMLRRKVQNGDRIVQYIETLKI